ncbi:MAG: ATPase [Pseudomonadota bacterium]
MSNARAAPSVPAPPRRFCALPSAETFLAAPHKSVALFGMSGVGKTRLACLLRDSGRWFHYSVDYRIGTRYMGEAIVDNFKREAMRVPLLRELLMSDSIYIASNIAFENLKPLSTYLGKPGDPAKGGIPFETYLERQRQHRAAEIAALGDVAAFVEKARSIYGYRDFLCDTGGSIVEVVNPEDPDDPVLTGLTSASLLVRIAEEPGDTEQLARRFDADPKPMYYPEELLVRSWQDYLEETGTRPEKVDPDAFIRWGFQRLLVHRAPLYAQIAERWGITISKREAEAVRSEEDFCALVATALARS